MQATRTYFSIDRFIGIVLTATRLVQDQEIQTIRGLQLRLLPPRRLYLAQSAHSRVKMSLVFVSPWKNYAMECATVVTATMNQAAHS